MASIDKKEYYQNYHLLNKEKINNRTRKHAIEYRSKYPERRLLSSAKQRAKYLNLKFDLEESDIVIPEYCPVFGFRLETGSRFKAPSLDRIIPDKGYTKNNIQVISFKANLMKQNASPEELRKFAEWILNDQKQSTAS